MQPLEEIVTQPRPHFVRRHWHILCVGLCLLVTFILGGFSVTELVLNVRYPVWLMVPWILVNVLLFLASVLLTLLYLFRIIRNPPDRDEIGDVVAFLAMFAIGLYLIFGIPIGVTGGASSFSWVVFIYMGILLIFDIIDMVMGIPQPKEKKRD